MSSEIYYLHSSALVNLGLGVFLATNGEHALVLGVLKGVSILTDFFPFALVVAAGSSDLVGIKSDA